MRQQVNRSIIVKGTVGEIFGLGSRAENAPRFVKMKTTGQVTFNELPTGRRRWT
jgi:hypothetical protein